ncbi:Predicted arabinose efflux permease, MFS family [Verrucomicrobium sp. GAS474]|uniref:MFS transporter n=1 Tax=Verrucomicrobium sp. GAS474 TaxID=1882831 RepID=UPI00087D0271|nr:MFS transporter [Verrucomicrobium sp. GAS474]SDT87209.1 Predicted arabinose efflux permease, MFS family [Verrucomicrobium sp. GAS474]
MSHRPAHLHFSQGTLWLMSLASGASVANIAYNQPLLGSLAAYFHASPAQVGHVSVASQVGYGVGLLFFLPLGDLLERRRLVVGLMGACILFLVAMACAPSLPLLVALQFCVAATAMSAQILIPMAVEFSPPEDGGRVVGTLMTGVLGGLLLGRTIGGAVSDAFGWRAVFAMAAAFMAAVAVAIEFRLPRHAPSREMAAMSYGRLMSSLWEVARGRPKLWTSSLVSALSFGSFTAFWTTLSFLMADRFHRGAAEAGLFGLVGLAGALAAPFFGRLADRIGSGRAVSLALVLGGVSFVLMGAWVTVPGLIVGVLLMDLGVQAVQVAEQAKIVALLPSARSRLNTIYMVMRFGGGAAGSLVGAVAWSLWQWPGVCAVGIALNTLAMAVHAAGREKRQAG